MPQDQSFGSNRAAFTPTSGSTAESSRVIKDSYCNLFGINCYSTAAGLLILLDQNTVPSNGAAIVPRKVFTVPANGMFIYDWSVPIRFQNGCVALFSTSLNPFVYTASNTAFISGDAA